MTAKLLYSVSILFAGFFIVSAQQPPLAAAATPPAAPPAAASVSAIGPKIAFETPIYDFGKVKSGEPVKHTFNFTNIGDEVLILTNVQPSCGCTTAGDWSRKVEPGKTGTIPIQFNSANYSGQVMKTVTVTSNDKSQPTFGLQLKGTIWKPIDMNPSFAVLNIPPDTQSNVTTKVHIVNNMEELVTLSPPEVNNSNFFTATLITNTPGKDFDVLITAIPPYDKPNMQAQVTVKTSSTNVPTLTVTAWANVQPAVAVNPPHAMIAAAPLSTKQTIAITIQNNSSTPLKLSDAAVDNKDAELKLTETNPGKTFSATVTFPQGFDMGQGKKVEFSVKSDNPKFAVIKVPISQAPKPAIAPAPAQLPHPEVIPVQPKPAPASASTTKPTGQ